MGGGQAATNQLAPVIACLGGLRPIHPPLRCQELIASWALMATKGFWKPRRVKRPNPLRKQLLNFKRSQALVNLDSLAFGRLRR